MAWTHYVPTADLNSRLVHSNVARMGRSAIRDSGFHALGFASLHPGYLRREAK